MKLVSDSARADRQSYAPGKQWHDKAGEYVAKHWKYLLAVGIAVPAIAIGTAGKKMHITNWDVYSALTERQAVAVTENNAGKYDGGIKLPDGSTVTLTPTATATPTVKATPEPAKPAPKYYLQSDDGLARIEFPGLTEEQAKPYLDKIHQQAQKEGAKFYGALTPEGKLLRNGFQSERLVIDKECWPCDSSDVQRIVDGDEKTEGLKGIYERVMSLFNPSKPVSIHFGISADGTKGNVRYFGEGKTLETVRRQDSNGYNWTSNHSQLAYELGVEIDRKMGYTNVDDVFLSEFLGQWASVDNSKKYSDYVKWRTDEFSSGKAYSQQKPHTFQQTQLGVDIDVALRAEGLTNQQIGGVIKSLEGKRATWEQFKAEVDAVAGRHLQTLDYIDQGVKLSRESRNQKQSYNPIGKGTAYASMSQTWKDAERAFANKQKSRLAAQAMDNRRFVSNGRRV